jgi:hypothetical protein
MWQSVGSFLPERCSDDGDHRRRKRPLTTQTPHQIWYGKGYEECIGRHGCAEHVRDHRVARKPK